MARVSRISLLELMIIDLDNVVSEVSRDLAASEKYIEQAVAPAAMLFSRYAIEKILNYSLQNNQDVDFIPNPNQGIASKIKTLKQFLPSKITTKLFKLNEFISPFCHTNPPKISQDEMKKIIKEIILLFTEIFGISLVIPKQFSDNDFYNLDKEYSEQIINNQGVDYNEYRVSGDSTGYNISKLEHASIHIDRIQSGGRELNVEDLLRYGRVKGELGRYDMSDNYFRQALDISEQNNDYENMSYALSNLSINASARGEFREALDLEKASYSVCIENDLLSSKCGSLNNLGCLSLEVGDYDSAEDYFNSALQLSKDLKDDQKQVAALINLAVLSQKLNITGKSDEYLFEAKKILENYDDTDIAKDRANVLFNIAYNLDERGEFDKAIEAYHESMDLKKTSNDIIGEAKILNNLAHIKIKQHEYDKAKKWIKKSLEIYRETGYKSGEAESLGNLSQITYFAEQNHKLAITYLQDSLKIDRIIGNKLGQAKTLNNLRFISADLGNKTDVEKYQRDRDDILEQIGLTVDDI